MAKHHDQLHEAMAKNELITYAYSRYLNHMPRLLNAEMVTQLSQDCHIPLHEAFLSLFATACGLEPDQISLHRTLEREYLHTGVHRLDPVLYENDPYYRTVKFSNQRLGKWEMCKHFYAPFEPFVCNHPVLHSDFCEIPQIGYFERAFHFPAILEGGVEWMTVTPNEIETMRSPIQKSCGKVLTLGLGLGYFAFRTSEKEDVERVTVIERDPDVIELVRTHILPQFPHADKIEIVRADALSYLEHSVKDADFDYIFADLWHDQSDGLELYLRLRQIERQQHIRPPYGFDYWIEPTLLSALRRIVYDKITDETMPLQLHGTDPYLLLSDDFLRTLAPNATL